MVQPSGSKSSLLDQLRAKADEVRERDALARPANEKAREDVDKSLWRAFRWFEEAIGHLEVIKPTIDRQFHLDQLLTLDRPRWDCGFASFRRRGLSLNDVLDHVEIYYRLIGPKPFIVRTHPSDASQTDARLRGSTLQFRYETAEDDKGRICQGVFYIEPAMRSSVLFAPDYDARTVEVTLSNVDRFEPVRLLFRPETIDTEALEDLLRLILGEPSSFLHRAPLALIKGAQQEATATGEDGETRSAG